ncbi:hypothetical protein G6F37_014278 [Rhizopus arrhizus]|nr:hypothetical protein G6F38_014122 [Rhizopus arrhizus]KAG1121888.1 hypothetical protein G6F37_014278 [Rhizopus arrhizus]
MWNTLKKRLFKQYDFPPISMDELWTRTFETWYEITERECQIYIETTVADKTGAQKLKSTLYLRHMSATFVAYTI